MKENSLAVSSWMCVGVEAARVVCTSSESVVEFAALNHTRFGLKLTISSVHEHPSLARIHYY